MNFYHKYYDSGYEELISYYPQFYRKIYEMTEILKAQGRIVDRLEDDIERTYLNCFIDYADGQTIERLEKFLEINAGKNRGLEERRRMIKSYFIGFGKLSASLVCRMLETYANVPVGCSLEPCDKEGNHALFLFFQKEMESTLYLSVIAQLMAKVLPAHIKYIVVFENVLDNRNLEMIRLYGVKVSMGIRFWECFIFDGSCGMDGTIAFGQKRRYGLVPGAGFHIALRSGTESIGKTEITVKRNAHFFDGSVNFDGSVIANAIYRKEVIE